MNLTFTPEQLNMQKTVREFVEKEVRPFVPEMEQGRFPGHLVKKMASLGLLGITVPKRYGGSNMDFTSYILTIHEIAKVSTALAVILSVHASVATNPVLYFGTEEQKQKYIPKLVSGEYLGAFCLTEPGAGSDVSGLKTRAEKSGNEYIINGEKVFITNGGRAGMYIVFARTNSDRGPKGITAFIVEKDTPGLVIGKDEKKMGLNGSKTVTLSFENMHIPGSRRLGREGEGYKIALSVLNAGRIGIAAQSLGIAEGAFLQALEYAKKRKQMKKQQGTAFKLAEMATKIEAARLLVYHAASLVDCGKNCPKAASMAKMFASDIAVEVATEMLDIFGASGIVKENDAERYFRDAKVTQIYEGTNEIQRVVIAKHL